MDGVLIDLLNAKWNTFVKFKFYQQFFTFAFYFVISLVAFTLRPGPPASKTADKNATNITGHHSLINGTNIHHISMKLIEANATYVPMTSKGMTFLILSILYSYIVCIII